jgi:hypothetical protein
MNPFTRNTLFTLALAGLLLAPRASTQETKPNPAKPAPQRAWRILTSQEYLKFHLTLTEPQNPEWNTTVRKVGEAGDDFTLWVVSELDKEILTPAQRQALDESVAVLCKHAGDNAALVTREEIEKRLEHAATADLQCHALESDLKKWTLTWLRQRLAQPGVRAMVTEIATGYTSKSTDRIGFGSLQTRVREYAKNALAVKS